VDIGEKMFKPAQVSRNDLCQPYEVIECLQNKIPALDSQDFNSLSRRRDRGFLGKLGIRRTSHEQDLIRSIHDSGANIADSLSKIVIAINKYKEEITKFNHMKTYSSDTREKFINQIFGELGINLQESIINDDYIIGQISTEIIRTKVVASNAKVVFADC
jgi:hypothetical protein